MVELINSNEKSNIYIFMEMPSLNPRSKTDLQIIQAPFPFGQTTLQVFFPFLISL